MSRKELCGHSILYPYIYLWVKHLHLSLSLFTSVEGSSTSILPPFDVELHVEKPET